MQINQTYMRTSLSKGSVIFIITLVSLSIIFASLELFFKTRGYLPVESPKNTGSVPDALGANFNVSTHEWYFWDTKNSAFKAFSPITHQTRNLRITLPASLNQITAIIWSPHNQYAFVSSNTGNQVLDFTKNTITALPTAAKNIAWTIEGETVAYQIITNASKYRSDIYTFHIPTKKTNLITHLDRRNSFFTEGNIRLFWGKNNTLYFSDAVLDASNPDWTALNTTTTSESFSFEPLLYSPDQKKLLFTKIRNLDNGAEQIKYGIQFVTAKEETITKLPASLLCDWETNETLLCLHSDINESTATINRYDISTNKYIPIKAVRISGSQLPNNSQFIKFDTVNRQLYVVTGGNTVYSVEY